MRRTDRVTQIQSILKEKHKASTRDLCSVFGVSESSIRRDIDFLMNLDPNVRRVHGGVVLTDSRDNLEYEFDLKLNLNLKLKERIANAAAALISDGDSLLIDSGTTCLSMIPKIHRTNSLRIVTLDVKISEELAKCENIESIIVGGLIRPGFYTIGGSQAIEMLDQFVVDKVFMSADAIDFDKGITNFSMFEVGVKKKITEIADELILIADHTKFGQKSFYKVTDIKKFSTIITTSELPTEYTKQIKEMGVNLILA